MINIRTFITLALLAVMLTGCSGPVDPGLVTNPEVTIEDVLQSLSSEIFYEYIEGVAEGDEVRKAVLDLDGSSFSVEVQRIFYGALHGWEDDILYTGDLSTGIYNVETNTVTISLNGLFATIVITDEGFILTLDGETITYLDESPYPDSDLFFDGPLLNERIAELNVNVYYQPPYDPVSGVPDFSIGGTLRRFSFDFDDSDIIDVEVHYVTIGIDTDWRLTNEYYFLKSESEYDYLSNALTTRIVMGASSFENSTVVWVDGGITHTYNGFVFDCINELPAGVEIFGPTLPEFLEGFIGKTYYGPSTSLDSGDTVRKLIYQNRTENSVSFTAYSAVKDSSEEWTADSTLTWTFSGIVLVPEDSTYAGARISDEHYVYFNTQGTVMRDNIYGYPIVDNIYYDTYDRSWGGLLYREPNKFLPGKIYFQDPSYSNLYSCYDFSVTSNPQIYAYNDYTMPPGSSTWSENTNTDLEEAANLGRLNNGTDNTFKFHFIYYVNGESKSSYRTIQDIGEGWFEMVYYRDSSFSTIMTNFEGDEMIYAGYSDPAWFGITTTP